MKNVLVMGYLLAAIVLTACGGGSGSSGGNDSGSSSGGYSISLDKQSMEFSGPIGANIPAQQITANFKGDGVIVGVPPGEILPSWLSVNQTTTSTKTVTFSISINADQYAAPEVTTATLRFVTGKSDGSNVVYKDLPVTLKLLDMVSADKDNLEFNSVFGSKNTLIKSFNVLIRDYKLIWTISSNQPWLSVSDTSDSGSKTVYVTANSAGLTEGLHTAELSIKDTNGFTKKITVNFNLQPRVIYANKRSAAFVSTGNINKLTGQIDMVDTAEIDNPNWQVTTDQSWIEITGKYQKRIELKVNPQGLPEGMHYGVVNITSTLNNTTSTERVNVGFYKTAMNSTEGNISKINSEWDNNALGLNLAEDPLRPFIYLTEAGQGLIRKINVHTGVEETPLPKVEGETFAGITMSSDGNTLYAHTAASKKIYKYNFVSNSWSSINITTNFLNPMNIEELHPNGKVVLLINQTKTFVDTQTGNNLFIDNTSFSGRFAVSGNQKSVYSIPTGITGGGLGITRMAVDYDLNNNKLSAVTTNFTEASISNGADIATNYDGSQINIASGGHYAFPVYVYDNGFLSYQNDWAGHAYPNSVEIGENGITYAGMSSYYDEDTVYAYDPQGELKQTYSIGTYRNILDGNKGMRLSGDGTRLLLISTEFWSGSQTSLWGFKAVDIN